MTTRIHVYPGEDLQRALDTAHEGDRICLAEGVYHRKIAANVPGVAIEGAGRDKTRILWGDAARMTHPDGLPLGTFRSFTCAVTADNVRMSGLRIENDAGDPGATGQQEALSVTGDGFVMEDCALMSTQDTLFCGPLPDDLRLRYIARLPQGLRRGGTLRQRFTRCLIAGTVDFIFGCGAARFETCELRSLVEPRGTGYCAAPAHALEQPEGFIFDNCAFTRQAGVPDGSVYLARPWRDHGLARFDRCTFDAHIAPAGFDPWGNSRRDLTARFYESPEVAGRVAWIRRG